jgi:hypothetical protein
MSNAPVVRVQARPGPAGTGLFYLGVAAEAIGRAIQEKAL